MRTLQVLRVGQATGGRRRDWILSQAGHRTSTRVDGSVTVGRGGGILGGHACDSSTHHRHHRHRNFVAGAHPGARLSPSTPLAGVGRFFIADIVGTHTVEDRHTVSYRIGIIGGDGIGPEVVAEAMKCVDAAGVAYEAVPFDLGGEPLPARRRGARRAGDLDAIRELDAVMLGAVGTPDVPPGVIERGLLLAPAVRARPLREPPAVRRRARTAQRRRRHARRSARTPRARTRARAASCARARPHEIATQGSVNTRMGVERVHPLRVRPRAVARAQAPHARAQDQRAHVRRRPLAAHVRRRSPPSTPTSTTAYHHVDAACIYFVQDPGRYDVIVTDNLFGDILTDLGGAVAGGIGRAASANLNPARTGPSLFEPVHGSAPDIAGTGQGRSARRDRLGRDDVGVPRRGRRRGASTRRRSTSPTTSPGSPPRSATRSRGGSECRFEKTEKIWMDGELVAVGRSARPRAHAHACTTAPACSRASAPTRRPTARRCSASPTTSSGCSTPPSCIMMDDPVLASTSSSRPCKLTVRENGLDSCYIRPIAYLGYGEMGLNPLPCEVNVSIAVWPWGAYLGDEGLADRRAHEGVVVAAHGPQRQPGRGQGHRHLHQLEPGQGRGAEGGLRRGDPAQHAGLRRRVHRREPLHREGRRARHAAARRAARSRASRATRS